jgi:hypothetical protein
MKKQHFFGYVLRSIHADFEAIAAEKAHGCCVARLMSFDGLSRNTPAAVRDTGALCEPVRAE